MFDGYESNHTLRWFSPSGCPRFKGTPLIYSAYVGHSLISIEYKENRWWVKSVDLDVFKTKLFNLMESELAAHKAEEIVWGHLRFMLDSFEEYYKNV